MGWDGVWEGLEIGFVGGRVSLVWCSLHLGLGSLGLIQVQLGVGLGVYRVATTGKTQNTKAAEPMATRGDNKIAKHVKHIPKLALINKCQQSSLKEDSLALDSSTSMDFKQPPFACSCLLARSPSKSTCTSTHQHNSPDSCSNRTLLQRQNSLDKFCHPWHIVGC